METCEKFEQNVAEILFRSCRMKMIWIPMTFVSVLNSGCLDQFSVWFDNRGFKYVFVKH